MSKKEIKIATIKGKDPKRIQEALDKYGILIYQRGKKEGRRKVVYVYTQDV